MSGEHPITRLRFDQRIGNPNALAKKANISRGAVVRAEAGRRIDYDTGVALSRALGVTYGELQALIPDQLSALPTQEAA